MVVPSYMGFSHYGDETYYDDPDNPFQAYRMSITYAIDFLVSIPDGVEFTPWDGDMKTQDVFLNRLLEALQATIAPDRDTFTKKRVEGNYTYEEVLSYIMRFTMTSDSAHMNQITDSLSDFVQYRPSKRESTISTARTRKISMLSCGAASSRALKNP